MDKLTGKQASVLQAINDGYSVAMISEAGTGKSFVIRQIIEQFSKTRGAIHVLCPTGTAAILVNGQTYHSFFGIGIGTGDKHSLLEAARKNPKTKRAFATRDMILVFDEAFMICGTMFDKLDYVARGMTLTYDRPFGGLQLVLAGDHRQLKSIGDETPLFLSDAWIQLFGRDAAARSPLARPRVPGLIFRFDINFRQQSDPEYAALMRELRTFRISPNFVAKIAMLARPLPPDPNGIEPAHICCHNSSVDRENHMRLAALPVTPTSPEYTYHAIDKGAPYLTKRADELFMAPSHLTLKINTIVMLLKNMLTLSPPLSNGSQGRVTRFDTTPPFYPYVLFRNGLEILIKPEVWEMRDSSRSLLISRKQVPLTPAWARTVYKSQGATADFAVINLAGNWSAQQAYVALSRVRNSRTVQIINFDPEVIKPDPILDQFEASLEDQPAIIVPDNTTFTSSDTDTDLAIGGDD